MLTLFLLLGTIPASAVERPFALKGAGVATLVTDEAGHLIGAIPTGSGTATYLGQWTVTGNVHYIPDSNGVLRSSGDATLTGDANFVVSISPVTGGFDLTVVGKINY